jgi:glycosyltransferase involved in cell wall biosynthesis
MASPTAAACTVVAANHLPFARVLARSLREHHPDLPLIVLLADASAASAPAPESFEILSLEDVGLPSFPCLPFQYTVFELTCAAKPFLVRTLLDRGIEQVIYLDADIYIVSGLNELLAAASRSPIVLTPHLTHDIGDDGRTPSVRDILDSGVYNGGMFAVSAHGEGRRFLNWLAERLTRDGLADLSLGQFVDQRWLTLAPGLFDGVSVLRHPGHNVGHWALSHRRVEAGTDGLTVDGAPLRSFHFSGFPFDDVEKVSRHQNRVTLDDVPALRPLFERYRDLAIAAGYEPTAASSYAFGRFDNGASVPALARRIYWRLGAGAAAFGRPFATGDRTFWSYLNEPTHQGSSLTRLWYEAYLSRADVRAQWPDPFGVDRDAVTDWVEAHGRTELQIDAAFGLPPARPRDAGTPAAPEIGPAVRALPGVNVIGHVQSEKGVGEAVRATARAREGASVPHAVVDFADPGSRNRDRSVVRTLGHHPFGVNVIHVNAEAFPYFVKTHGPRGLRDRYNIGVWMWELSRFPAVFGHSFAYVDEVWVPSTFCLDAVSHVSPVPVVRMPVALPEGLDVAGFPRSHFGLPDGVFVFLFVFDVDSIVERKNPVGAIRAFRRAFGAADNVLLLLKLAHGTAAVRAELEREAEGANVRLLDALLDRDELHGLMAAADAYVSLHRSEGFGITIAEAMALGKPVIATAYSGNLDFMRADNSFPVRYSLVPLDRPLGPYPKGDVWADPDLDDAASLMAQVAAGGAGVTARAATARRSIRDLLSPAAVGARMKARLEQIGAHRE